MPNQDFLITVFNHLEKCRLLTTELFVLPPKYIEILVSVQVVAKPKSLPSKVKENVKNKLENFLHPVSGGFDSKGWPFGRSVYRSEIYEIIDGVEGVSYVKSVSLRKLNSGSKDGLDGTEGDIDIPAEGLIFLSELQIDTEEETYVFGI